MDVAEEIKLIEKAKIDVNSFLKLYDIYFNELLAYAINRVGYDDLAEEVVVEAFLNLAASLQKFDTKKQTSLAPWLYKRVNQSIGEQAAKAVEQTQTIDSTDQQKEFLLITQSLKPDLQDVFSLKIIAGLNKLQTALAMSISETKVLPLLYKSLTEYLKKFTQLQSNSPTFELPAKLDAKSFEQILQYFNDLLLVSEADVAKTSQELKAELREVLYTEYLKNFNKTNSFDLKKIFTPKLLMVLGVLILLTGVIVLITKLTASNNTDNSDNTTIASEKFELNLVEGAVEYSTDGKTWQKAEQDLELAQGNYLKTLSTGRAELKTANGSLIRMDYSSQIQLVKITQNDFELATQSGNTYVRLTEETEDFKLAMTEATFTASGTAFLTFNQDNLKGVQVYHSQVQVDLTEGDDVDVFEGEEYYLTNAAQRDLENKISTIKVSKLKKDDFVMWNKSLDESISAFSDQMGILADFEAPFLTVSFPTDGYTTTEETIIIEGLTTEDAIITINGVGVINNDGAFSYEVDLVVGENTLTIIVADESNNQTKKVLKITRGEITPTPSITPTAGLTNTPAPTATVTPVPTATDTPTPSPTTTSSPTI